VKHNKSQLLPQNKKCVSHTHAHSVSYRKPYFDTNPLSCHCHLNFIASVLTHG